MSQPPTHLLIITQPEAKPIQTKLHLIGIASQSTITEMSIHWTVDSISHSQRNNEICMIATGRARILQLPSLVTIKDLIPSALFDLFSCCQYSPDGKFLVCGGLLFNSIYVFDSTNQYEFTSSTKIGTEQLAIAHVTFSPSSSSLAAISCGGVVSVLAFPDMVPISTTYQVEYIHS